MYYYHDERGGKREGAGRPKIGVTKKISITLTAEEWNEIDDLVVEAKDDPRVSISSRSALFRSMYYRLFKPEKKF